MTRKKSVVGGRILLVVATPFVVPFAFFYVLTRDIGRAFRSAYIEVRIELASAKEIWRDGI